MCRNALAATRQKRKDMLTRFTVSNYRGFETPVTLDLCHPREYTFNTSYVADGIVRNSLVIGPNTSGKTNLLKALADIRMNFFMPDSAFAPPQFDDGFLNANTTKKAAEFEYEFRFGNTSVGYRYAKTSSHRIADETLAVDHAIVSEYSTAEGLGKSKLDIVGADNRSPTACREAREPS